MLHPLSFQYFEIRDLTKLAPNYYLIDFKQYQNEISDSFFSRMAFSSFVYFVLILCQFMYQKYFNENFGFNKMNDFIDLCSVSNVSIFELNNHNKLVNC